jgi:hypothetical protein
MLLPESIAADGNNKRDNVKIHVIFEGTTLDIHVGRLLNLSFSLGVDVAGALGVVLSAGDGRGMWILGRGLGVGVPGARPVLVCLNVIRVDEGGCAP